MTGGAAHLHESYCTGTQKIQPELEKSGRSENCRNEDLAITVCKSESRKKTCDGILLRLLDHFDTFTVIGFFLNNMR